jgi:hypothetical protein
MTTGVALFESFIISFLILCILPGIGLLLIHTFFEDFSRDNFLRFYTISIAFGLGFLDLMDYYLSNIGISPVLPNKVFFYLSIIALGFFVFRVGLDKCKPGVAYLSIATVIGFWQLLPGLFTSAQAGGSVGMVTRGNNDIAYYVAVTQEYLNSGFRNSGHVAGITLNHVAKTGLFFTPIALITFIACGLGLAAWQVAMPAMILAGGLAILSITRLVRLFFKDQKTHLAFGIASLVLMSSFMSYIFVNGFFGQVLSISVSSLILVNVMEFVYSNKPGKLLLGEATLLVILSIFTYPNLLFAIYVLAIGFGCLVLVLNKRKLKFLSCCQYFAALSVGTILSIPFIPVAIGMIRSISVANAGWPIAPMNPLGMFVWPELIGSATAPLFQGVLWTSLFLFIILAFIRGQIPRNEKIQAGLFAALSIVGTIAVITIRNRGFADYSAWKLMSYAIPLIFAAVLPVFIFGFQYGKILLIFSLGVVSMSSLVTWNGIPATGTYTNRDMINLSKMHIITNLKALNVDLSPYFETMASVSILKGPKLYLNSISYLPTSINGDACTLVRRGNLKYKFMKPLNATYGLASNIAGSCNSRTLNIELGEIIKVTGSQKFSLGEGWSTPESWGTWSDGEKASLEMQIDSRYPNGLTLSLDSSTLLSASHQSLRVDVLANEIKVGVINYSLADNRRIRSFAIPPQALETNPGTLQIVFAIHGAVSPKSLGLSNDPRQLGIGLVSIELSAAILKTNAPKPSK